MQKKLPYYKVYPGDEKRSGIYQCSLRAEGLLKRIRDLAHDGDKRGYLMRNGRGLTDQQISAWCEVSVDEYLEVVSELFSVGILKKSKEEVTYESSLAAQEVIRKKRQKSGRKGGISTLLKQRVLHGAAAICEHEHDNEHETDTASFRDVVVSVVKDLKLYSKDLEFCKKLSIMWGEWQKEYPGIDLADLLKRMHMWELANGKYERRAQAFGGWLKREKKYLAQKKANEPKPVELNDFEREYIKRQEEQANDAGTSEY